MEGFLNMQEIKKLSVIREVLEGRLSTAYAQEHLGVCRDTIWRLKKLYQAKGPAGFAHGLRGRPSNRGANRELRDEVLRLYQEQYQEHDFGIRHFWEEAQAQFSKPVAYSTVWRWLRQSGTVLRKRRASPHRSRRARKECFGELIQMDTSIHDWTRSGKKTCLISAIDDASGIIVGARFFEADTTLGNMQVMKDIFENYGLPIAFYVDRSPIFKVTRTGEGRVYRKKFTRGGVTQVQRALAEMGVELIHAYSPQAKGRIERSYGTWQDRLVSELSKEGIKDLVDCNNYTQSHFLAKFNQRFAVDSDTIASAFVPLFDVDLDQYMAEKYDRVVTNDHVVSCKVGGLVAQIKPDQYRASYARANVEVYRHINQSHTILYQGRKLQFEPLK